MALKDEIKLQRRKGVCPYWSGVQKLLFTLILAKHSTKEFEKLQSTHVPVPLSR